MIEALGERWGQGGLECSQGRETVFRAGGVAPGAYLGNHAPGSEAKGRERDRSAQLR